MATPEKEPAATTAKAKAAATKAAETKAAETGSGEGEASGTGDTKAADNTPVGASAENQNPSETDKTNLAANPASETKPSDVDAEFKKAAETIVEKESPASTRLGEGIKHYRITNNSIHPMRLIMLDETVPARVEGAAGSIDVAIHDKDIAKVNRALAQRNAVIRTIAFNIEVIAE